MKARKGARYWFNLIGVAVLALAIVISSLGVWLAHGRAMNLIHPSRSYPQGTPATVGIENWEDVSFLSPDGLRITAWFVPPKPAAKGATIIYVHGMGGNRGQLLHDAALLYESGFGALLIDFRNNGNSEGEMTTLGLYEPLDVHGAVDYLLTRPEVDPNRIGILGHSMGGATTIIAAAQISEIAAVVAQSAYTSLEDNISQSFQALTGLPPFPFAPLVIWFSEHEADAPLKSVSPISVIAEIAPRPLLLVHGELDALISVENAHNLYAAAQEPKSLYILPNAEHGNFPQIGAEEYRQRITGFFTEHLINP